MVAVSPEFMLKCMGIRFEVTHDNQELALSSSPLSQHTVQRRNDLFVSDIGTSHERRAGYGNRRAALEHAQLQEVRKCPSNQVEQDSKRRWGKDRNISRDGIKSR